MLGHGAKVKFIAFAMVLALVSSFIPAARVEASEGVVLSAKSFRNELDITTVHIGSDVTEITSGAFRNLIRLRSITVSDNNPYYASYSNCLYDKDMTVLLCFPAALSGAVIPASVVSIGENALYGVPDGLKEEIRNVIHAQAAGNLMEWEVPGSHFIHTEYGIKWRKEDGTLIQPDTELKKLVAAVLDNCTTSGMSQEKQLESCFNYFVNSFAYQREMDVPIGNWTGAYAEAMLKDGSGNCYKYAAAFGYIARGLGYETRVCSGTVRASTGGRTGHAWVEIKMSDKWYVFDPEMQDAKGSGYYKVTYDSYPAGPIERSASWVIEY
ncbi:transglutaminase domain-containing protein [Butyrivibrio proteoclasticus]|uniref:transglutaminase domain-containing protein n=1 Tax=Butyrivibrio proteoclasticus TaxID=43305 RepID=UPI0009DCBD4A|nr:transglutaminase domain-containing protein [Butyrivibrio proteoclasticus]